MRAGWAALALVVMALAVGCTQHSSPHRDAPAVVASTAVWGSVAAAVVGGQGTVRSILDGAVDDPHSFQPSPTEAAEIGDASLVVLNGGHYDQWFSDVLANNPDIPAVDAFSLLAPHQQAANEHIFYDPATAKAVAAQIADRLAELFPANGDGFRANAAEFGKRADEILATQRAIGAAHPGAAVVATEPVAYYLLVNAGLTDKTPPGFTSSIEADSDPSPADLAAMLDLISTRQVSALLFNPQTQTAVTKRLQDAATRAGIAVVTVTENLPEGTDFLTWQRQTAENLRSQLDACDC